MVILCVTRGDKDRAFIEFSFRALPPNNNNLHKIFAND